MTDLIEVPPEIETDAKPTVQEHKIDTAQARIESVAKILDAAYQKASMLELSADEAKLLTAPFPDEAVRPGAKGKENLLYLEHASVRMRMHEVFGPGHWSSICRRMWTEQFRTSKGGEAIRVYADCVLIVRGAYVGESIGAGSYYPNNAEQDYSDAAEAAQSEALRRICGKFLGIGLQLWNKAYCDGVKSRRTQPNGQSEQDAPVKPSPWTPEQQKELEVWDLWLYQTRDIPSYNDGLNDWASIKDKAVKSEVWKRFGQTAKTKYGWTWNANVKKFEMKA